MLFYALLFCIALTLNTNQVASRRGGSASTSAGRAALAAARECAPVPPPPPTPAELAALAEKLTLGEAEGEGGVAKLAAEERELALLPEAVEHLSKALAQVG